MPLERVASRPTWLLSRANIRAQDLLGEAFAVEGLRGYHFRLLAALDQYGPSSQADLGRHTGIDRSDVVAALNELVDRGLTRREPDPADGRRNVVTITTRGRTTLDRVDAALDDVQAAVLAPLTAHERTTFVRLLTKLVRPPEAEDPGGTLSGPTGV
jgi:MarR family transcriptional regulator, lower aerobic nicotinate degradation pathway regulator